MVDLTIHGAGVFGLTCGYVAAKRGARVQVIDPHGVGAGSSGGVVGALAPHTPERWNDKKAFQFDSLIQSRSFWPAVEADSGLPTGYGRTGRIQAIETPRQLELAHERAQSAKTLWAGQAEWTVLTERPAWAPDSPTGHWVYDTLSARIYPKLACAALAQAIVNLGGAVRTEGAPKGLQLHATGWAGLKALSAAFGQEVGNGVKGQSILLEYNRPDAPQIYADSLHIVPHENGTVAIGSTSERLFETPNQTDEHADELLARARQTLPELAEAKELARWAGVRPRALSRAPMLGPWPERPDHFIANGGFKIGFGMAPKCAEVMIDLMLSQKDAIPEAFRVEASLK